MTFETKEIAKEVDEFAAVKAIKSVREKTDPTYYDGVGRKGSYIISCHILMILMDEAHVKLGGKKLTAKA